MISLLLFLSASGLRVLSASARAPGPALTEHAPGSHVADCAFTLRMLFARTWPRPRHCARSIPHWASPAGPGSPPPGGWGTFRPRARAPCRAGVEAGRCSPGCASVRGSWGAGEPAPAAARTPALSPPRAPPGGQRHIQPLTQVDCSPRRVSRPTPPGGPGSPTFHRWSRASLLECGSPPPQSRKLWSATCGVGVGKGELSPDCRAGDPAPETSSAGVPDIFSLIAQTLHLEQVH